MPRAATALGMDMALRRDRLQCRPCQFVTTTDQDARPRGPLGAMKQESRHNARAGTNGGLGGRGKVSKDVLALTGAGLSVLVGLAMLTVPGLPANFVGYAAASVFTFFLSAVFRRQVAQQARASGNRPDTRLLTLSRVFVIAGFLVCTAHAFLIAEQLS